MFLNNWKKLKNCHKISKGYEMIDISDKPELQLKVPNNSGDAVLIKQINTKQGSAVDVKFNGFLNFGNDSGSAAYISFTTDERIYNIGANSSSYPGWIMNLGSSPQPVDAEDYKLYSEYEYGTNLKQLNSKIECSLDCDNAVKRVVSTFEALTDMNINEVGMSANVDSSIKNGRVLFVREVLSQPLNVTSGQVFSVELSFTQRLE